MGFWNDYFKQNLGGKLRNTIGNIVLRGKWGSLMDKYKETPQMSYGQSVEAPQIKEEPTTKTTEQPTINPVGEYETQPEFQTTPEGESGGMRGQTDGIEGLDKLQPKRLEEDTTPIMFKKYGTPVGEAPLLPNKDKGKVNTNAILNVLDPIQRQKYNEQLFNEISDFMLTAQRFPEIAPQYGQLAQLFLQKKGISAPTTPKFEPKTQFTDRNGNLYRYEYNWTKGRYEPVPVTSEDGKQIQTKLPQTQDVSKFQWKIGDNGNAFYLDPQDMQWKDAGSDYYNLFPKIGMEQQELEEKIKGGYFTKNLGGSNKQGSTGKSSQTSEVSVDQSTGALIGGDGMPLERETRRMPKAVFVGVDEETGEKQYQTQMAEVQGYSVNGEFIPDTEIRQFIDDLGSKNDLKIKTAIQQMKDKGIKINVETGTLSKVGTEKMKMMSDEITKAKSNYTPEQFDQYLGWLKANYPEEFKQTAEYIRDSEIKKIMKRELP